MKKKYKALLITCIFIILISLSFYSSIMREAYYLILISFIIAYSLKPIYIKLVKRGFNTKASALLLICTFFITVLVILGVLIPSMFKENQNISDSLMKFQAFFDNINIKVKLLNNNFIRSLVNTGYDKFNTQLLDLSKNIFDCFMNAGEDILSFAVIPIIVYYILADNDSIYNNLLMLFPVKSRTLVKNISKDIDKVLGRYILSQFILCIIVGILTFIVLFMYRIDFPILLSLLNAFFNIIPYFGPVFGAIPALIIALMSSYKAALYVAIWLYVLQQIEGNILSPKITGDSISIHPLIVIILLIIGGKVGGLLGMVLAIPIGVVIKVIYEDLNYYLF